MKAIVLVGGFGTRLRPLTFDVPKQMLPIARKPMIEWVVEHLASFGVDEVVLSLGFQPDQFIAAYPEGKCGGVKLVYAVEPEPLDTAGAIAFAARETGLSERFFVLNGDVLTDADLSRLLALHESAEALATILLTPVEDPSRYGVVVTDSSGRVREFVEKPPAGSAPSNLINAGIYVVERGFLEYIPSGRPVSVERETFPKLAAEGKLFAFGDDSYWIDAGTPESYVRAQIDLVSGLRGDRGIPWLDATADVDPRAEIDRSVLYEGVRVGPGSRVVESILLPGASIGADCGVCRAIIGPSARVGDGCHLDGWTVLGPGVALEPGAKLSGVRIPDPDRGESVAAPSKG